MCCLFGLIDTELRFTGKEKSKMLHALASASEARERTPLVWPMTPAGISTSIRSPFPATS